LCNCPVLPRPKNQKLRGFARKKRLASRNSDSRAAAATKNLKRNQKMMMMKNLKNLNLNLMQSQLRSLAMAVSIPWWWNHRKDNRGHNIRSYF
jgi:hypothetical protein